MLAIQVADARAGDDGTASGTVRAIIGFYEPVTDDDVKYLESLGGVVIHRYDIGIYGVNLYLPKAAYDKLVAASQGADVKDSAATAFAKKIKAIEEDMILYGADAVAAEDPTGTTALASSQFIPGNIYQVNADDAWRTTTGNGVRVAVLDTGIDKYHEDLRVAGGYSCVDYTSDWMDDHGHGTECAGIIAALDNDVGIVGVAPDVDLYAVKAGNSQNEFRIGDIIEGIRWCIENNIQVISISAGGSGSGSKNLRDIIADANNRGIFMCACAGNEDMRGVNYPANYPQVVAVAAVDSENHRVDPDYDGTDWGSNWGPEVFISAPGFMCFTTIPGNGYTNEAGGTSIATPHVAGAAALILEAYPGVTPNQIKQRLQLTAIDIDASGRDQNTGFGLLNAYGASRPGLDTDISGIIAPGPVRGRQTATVTITMKNMGFLPWSNGYTLCGINGDATLFSKGNTYINSIPKGTTVKFEEEYTFKVPLYVKKDIPEGDYYPTYRMRQDLTGTYFGDAATFKVTVDNTPPEVVSYSPTGDNVRLDSMIKITYNEELGNVGPTTMGVEDAFTREPVRGIVRYDSNTRTVTFTPAEKLEPWTVYAVLVSNNVADLAGNGRDREGLWYWTFTTTADITPPTAEVSPADGSVVQLDVHVTAQMSEPIDFSSVNENTLIVRDSSGNRVDAGVILDRLNNIIRLEFMGTHGMTYTATIQGVTDLVGNIMAPYSWSFTAKDLEPPYITSYDPPRDARDVLVYNSIRAVFNEEIDSTSVTQSTIQLRTSDDGLVDGTVAHDGTDVVFMLKEPLMPGTGYTITVSGARDLAGNEMAPDSWSFTTTTDSERPYPSEMFPESGAVNVPRDASVYVKFNEEIDLSSVTQSSITLYEYDETAGWITVPGEVYMAGDYLYFTPARLLDPGHIHQITLRGIKDLAGNVMLNWYWQFTTTTDTTAPSTLLLVDVSQTNGWYNCDPLIQFVPQDPDDDVNEVSTYYTLDGVAYEYSDVFYVRGDGEHTLSYYSVDPAGNVGPTEIFTVRIDTVKPTIAISTPLEGDTYTLGQTVLAEWSVTDDRSGVDSAAGTYESGKAIDTSSTGAKEFTVTATDTAGNTNTVTVNYNVA